MTPSSLQPLKSRLLSPRALVALGSKTWLVSTPAPHCYSLCVFLSPPWPPQLWASGNIIHHPLLLLLSAGSRTCPFISWQIYLVVYSLTLNTATFLILVNFHIRVDCPSKHAGFVMTWASPPKTCSPPTETTHSHSNGPGPCQHWKVWPSVPSMSPRALFGCLTIFSLLSSSPSLIIPHLHLDLQISWPYHLFPLNSGSVPCPLTGTCWVLMCSDTKHRERRGKGEGKERLRRKKTLKNLRGLKPMWQYLNIL